MNYSVDDYLPPKQVPKHPEQFIGYYFFASIILFRRAFFQAVLHTFGTLCDFSSANFLFLIRRWLIA